MRISGHFMLLPSNGLIRRNFKAYFGSKLLTCLKETANIFMFNKFFIKIKNKKIIIFYQNSVRVNKIKDDPVLTPDNNCSCFFFVCLFVFNLNTQFF